MRFENGESRVLRKVNLGRLTNAEHRWEEHRWEEDGRQEPSNVVAVQLDVVRWEIPVLSGRRPNRLFRRPRPGHDFGQSPILMKLRGGRQDLAAPSRRLAMPSRRQSSANAFRRHGRRLGFRLIFAPWRLR